MEIPEEERKVEAAVLDGAFVSRGPAMPLTAFGKHHVSVCSKIGRRRRQEDRLCVCPKVLRRDGVAFYAVYDGTVGCAAAELAHRRLLGNIVASPAFRLAVEHADDPAVCQENVAKAVRQAFEVTDLQLLDYAAKAGDHYTASTAVTATIVGSLLTVAHVGDSKAAVGQDTGGAPRGRFLTFDHKPDLAEELARIESMGGQLTYLHGGKPFLRGGDFAERRARGDRPMQLNYSRAFGGKDLKPYGLTAAPEVLQLRLTPEDSVLILGSDGLWDVVNPDVAVARALDARRMGKDPATELVDLALEEHDLKRTVDNVTCVVVFLEV